MLRVARWCAGVRGLAVLGILLLPLLSACSGLRWHKAQDARLAQEAQTAFKDAGLVKALDSERLLVAEQNQRHRAALRAHAEALRDVSLVRMVAARGVALRPLEDAVVVRSTTLRGDRASAMEALGQLTQARDDATRQLATAQQRFADARKAYESALAKGCTRDQNSAHCLAQLGDDLATKLQDLGAASAKLGSPLDRGVRGNLARVGQQLRSLACVLAALTPAKAQEAETGESPATATVAPGSKPDCAPAGSPGYGAELRMAATLSSIDQALTKAKQPPVSALVIEAERLRLQGELLQRRLDQEITRIAIMELRLRLANRELERLDEATTSIATYRRRGECDQDLTLLDAVRFNRNPACGEIAAQALLAYATAWNSGRIPAREAEAELIALRHEAVLDTSETAFGLWDQALGIPIARVLAHHEGGIRAEDLANLIHALGLGAIAVRVK